MSKELDSEQDKQIVGTILARRENAALRSTLRFGDSTTLWPRAVPQLAALYLDKTYLRAPLLLFAAAAARGNSLPQGPLSLGQLVASLVRSKAMSETSAEDRLGRLVSQDLPAAHRQIRSFLALAQSSPNRLVIDWFGLWRLYRSWGNKNYRVRILEDYYQALSPKTLTIKSEEEK